MQEKNFGFVDKGSSGGYQHEKLDEGMARKVANAPPIANEAAAKVKTSPQENHVGGSRAGT